MRTKSEYAGKTVKIKDGVCGGEITSEFEWDDEKFRELLQEDAERDADRIVAEVNSDPSLKDVVAPEEIHDKLMGEIRKLR